MAIDLYRAHAADVHRFALYLSGDRAIAEDLTAETFVRALVGRDRLRVDTVRAYLLAIARNLYRDLLRREGRLVSIESIPSIDGMLAARDPAPMPDVAADDRRRLEVVLAAMQRLPPGEREALILASHHELPYDRIAAILGCPTPAVKVRVYRARLKLKAILDMSELRGVSDAPGPKKELS